MIFSAWDRRHCLDASPSSRSFVRVVFLGRTVMACTLGPLSESCGAMKIHVAHRGLVYVD